MDKKKKPDHKQSIQKLINFTVNRLEIIYAKTKDYKVKADLNDLMIDLSLYTIPVNTSEGRNPDNRWSDFDKRIPNF